MLDFNIKSKRVDKLMAISTESVKELRERTGLGMMECKKALVSTNGDIEKAIEELRKSGQAKAAKKAGRIAAEGIIAAKVNSENNFAVIVEVNSETDFVARDQNFVDFVNEVVEAAFSHKSSSAENIISKMEKQREVLIQKIGENVSIRRIDKIEGDVVNSYVHNNHKIGVLTVMRGGSIDLARDVSMHIAATSPEVVHPSDMPESLVNKEKEILRAQALESGKPAEIVEKMIDGRIKKFLAENSLSEQSFVKNPDVTVGQLTKDANAFIKSFIRYEVGEGIEKSSVDFAQEVAEASAQAKN